MIRLDENQVARDLEPLLEVPCFRVGATNLADDPFFVAFFLVSVSQGEGLGEAAVAMIGQDELAGPRHGLLPAAPRYREEIEAGVGA
jgi:hypothetical protein